MLKYLKKINNFKPEEQSLKFQEKFAEQYLSFSTNMATIGFAGMFTLLGLSFNKYVSRGEFFSAFVVFVVCLIFSRDAQMRSAEIYDRINPENDGDPKKSSEKVK